MRVERICAGVFLLSILFGLRLQAVQDDLSIRQGYLEQLVSVLPPDRPNKGRVSPFDATWRGWIERTGELPPNFDAMESLPFLPAPLVIDQSGKKIPVKTVEQWRQKRKWIKQQIKYWVTGTFPPEPNNLKIEVLSEKKNGKITERNVLLSFGPGNRAKLHVNLLIPPGKGPFPVFLTQWKKRPTWVQVAVRRGYIGCRYTATDPAYGHPDDSESYAQIWYPEYDFSGLMRWAWAAQRAVDYLHTLEIVDKDKIGITGHSRNGKASLMAAAFDERIKAVIPSSGGTGAEDPFRYTSDKFDNETIEQITTNFPHWLHPRLRFFVGREHKLPVDQNLMMALVSPRGLMFSSAITEHQGNPWGIEQCYRSVERVYEFLGAEDKLAIRFRDGRHGTFARDIEAYVDFFDHVFGRSKIAQPRKLYYDYSFDKWRKLSAEKINPLDYPAKGIDELLGGIDGVDEWQKKKAEIKKRIAWGLGDEPAGHPNTGKMSFENMRSDNAPYTGDHIARVIGRPKGGKKIGRRVIYSGSSFGDYLSGELYYPADEKGEPVSSNLPVVVWLHEYAYPTGFGRGVSSMINGFVNRGFAVFLFDQIGFGTRIEEGTLFYQRYKSWSKMGRMVADTKAAVDVLSGLEFLLTISGYVWRGILWVRRLGFIVRRWTNELRGW